MEKLSRDLMFDSEEMRKRACSEMERRNAPPECLSTLKYHIRFSSSSGITGDFSGDTLIIPGFDVY
jgi:hypothetical protein